MSNEKQQIKEDLEAIIRALADVWPNDRENVAIAGAKFEELITGFDRDLGQLQKLIDMAWEGLKHLFENDDYFTSVKTATLQAINTIREYIVNDGDIDVKDFEKAYDDLYDALAGEKESADTLIELEEETGAASDISRETKTLDDLASFILGLNEEISDEEVSELKALVNILIQESGEKVASALEKARRIAENLESGGIASRENWLSDISMITEEAIHIASEDQWQDDTEGDELPGIQTTEEEERAGQADTEPEDFYIPGDIDTALMGEFVTECTELLDMAEGALLDLEDNPEDEELVNKVFRAFHTIKGTSAFMGLEPITEFTHLLETMLSMVREGEIAFDTACADISLEAIDIITKMLEVIEASEEGDRLPRPMNFDRLTAVLERVSSEGTTPGEALSAEGGLLYEVPSELDGAQAAGTANGEAKTNGSAKSSADDSPSDASVRVNVNRLDQLIDMVGELVIAHSVVAQDQSIPDHSELQKKINHTSKILRELQDTSLTLRMVPLNATFHKMNRLIRDLSRKAGKSVTLITAGGDTEIDRNMVDIINEPLVHMIRNAIDHGIEKPGDREANGKSGEANIWLRASQEGGKVVIEIEDDGRGINKKKVVEKAVSKGLVDADANLSDKEIYNLIFLPGFSSADEVTDLSGRGVGMDVVRRSIQDLKGKIDIESEEGKGTRIIIELPFTLAITDGMLVRVGGQRFIIPVLNIDQAFQAREKDVFTVMGQSEKVSIRGETVPIVRLHHHFGISDGIETLTEGTLLAIRNANKKYALLVDEVVGQQQLVGKSINMKSDMAHVSGGAILGDGTVGLILDTAALMRN